jgi:hypothetical protein
VLNRQLDSTVRRTLALVGGAVVASMVFAVAPARAEQDACKTAHDLAPPLFKPPATELLEARRQLSACAKPECASSPSRKEAAQECTAWLSEVEARIPSIVPTAKDASGADLADVQVTMDGNVLATKPGAPIEVDPGVHRFVFARAGSTVKLEFTVQEGTKDQRVVATFPGPPARKAEPPGAMSERKKYAILLGATALTAIMAGAFFGWSAAQQWDASKTDCSTTATCKLHDVAVREHDGAEHAAKLSTISLVGGGIALAAAVVLYLTGTPAPGAPPGAVGKGSLSKPVFAGASARGLSFDMVLR